MVVGADAWLLYGHLRDLFDLGAGRCLDGVEEGGELRLLRPRRRHRSEMGEKRKVRRGWGGERATREEKEDGEGNDQTRRSPAERAVESRGAPLMWQQLRLHSPRGAYHAPLTPG